MNKKIELLRQKILLQMQSLICEEKDFPREFYDMFYYHHGWSEHSSVPISGSMGKMLRPIFGLLCCEMVDGDIDQALLPSAAVELLHNFSLIHDDVQDDSLMRRGRKTVWTIWGKPQAINAGDALFTIARNALLKMQNDPQVILHYIQTMDQACLALCKGQYLDMSFEKKMQISIDEYFQMIRLKTGTLWGLAGYLGVYIITQDQNKAQMFKNIGENIGIGFQIQDDILSIWGNNATGKTNNDLQNYKRSLPILHALNISDTTSKKLQLYQKGEISNHHLIELRKHLENAGSKQFSIDKAAQYIKEAAKSLQTIKENSLCEHLINSLLTRNH